MTKMKSKKMTKSTFAIIIMAIAMVALLAFGGTYAYFTATTTAAESTQTLTTGKVVLGTAEAVTLKLDLAEDDTRTLLLPGDSVIFRAAVGNDSNVKIYAFMEAL